MQFGRAVLALGLAAAVVAVVAGVVEDVRHPAETTAAGSPTSTKFPIATVPLVSFPPRPTLAPHITFTLPSIVRRETIVLPAAPPPPPTLQATVPPTVHPCSLPEDESRPGSGADLRARSDSGIGTLEVRNGTAGDTIVKLVTLDESPHAVLAVYVRASETITISGVPELQLRVVFSSGSHWSDATQTFSCHQSAKEFEDVFDFTSSNWEVTLYGIPGGNAETSNLDVATFNAY